MMIKVGMRILLGFVCVLVVHGCAVNGYKQGYILSDAAMVEQKASTINLQSNEEDFNF